MIPLNRTRYRAILAVPQFTPFSAIATLLFSLPQQKVGL
jgi:hypothetical protein